MTDSNGQRRRATDTRPEVDDADVDDWFYNFDSLRNRLDDSRRQFLFLFAFITVIGMGGAFLLQNQQNHLEDDTVIDRKSAYDLCRVANRNAVALNTTLDTIIVSVKQSTVLTPLEKAERVASYETAKQTLPVCRRP